LKGTKKRRTKKKNVRIRAIKKKHGISSIPTEDAGKSHEGAKKKGQKKAQAAGEKKIVKRKLRNPSQSKEDGQEKIRKKKL